MGVAKREKCRTVVTRPPKQALDCAGCQRKFRVWFSVCQQNDYILTVLPENAAWVDLFDLFGTCLYFLSKAQGMGKKQLLNVLSEPEFSEAVELMSGFTK